MNDMLVKKNILGVGITDATEKEILEYIIIGLDQKREKYYIITPNPEIITFAHHHPDFKTILNRANLALNDGIGVVFASKILGVTLKARVTGTDMVESICREVSKKPITVGFLGGRPGVAEKTAECLMRKYPGLKVRFAASEWPDDGLRSTDYRLQSAVDRRQFAVDILFVAYGFPKQEEWMHEHIDRVPVKVMMGVGGAFDYISGMVPRAPYFVRMAGLEWLFRLIIEPWRIKRQLALFEFIWLVIKEKWIRFDILVL